MPSSMTHTYFGNDVLKELPIKYQNKINSKINHFHLFCQGSDPFMFYHFLIGKQAKQMKKLQQKIHTEKTREYFIYIIKEIHSKKLINNPEIMAYLYGNICHYYSDLYIHPFVFYKTGIFNYKDKNTYSYNGLHQEMEYMFDLYLIRQREKIPYQKFRIHDEIFQKVSFSIELETLINNTIKEIYSYQNIIPKYYQSIWYTKKFFEIFNYDPYGIKLKLYKIIDYITPKWVQRTQELSYYNDYSNKLYYLNLDNKEWFYPWDKNKTSKYSFFDLYNKAKQDSINTIKEVTTLLEKENLNINKLQQIFTNLSYVTGEDCNKKLELKYFEKIN